MKLLFINSYSVILNPYGGVYPENNLGKNETLNKIFRYVKNGGIFVNVADVPGYYAYNNKSKRKIETGLALYDPFRLDEIISFNSVPFIKELCLKIIGTYIEVEHNGKLKLIPFKDEDFEIEIERAVKSSNNTDAIYKWIDFNGEKITAFFIAQYGKGYFIISLLKLNTEKNKEISQKIIENIKIYLKIINRKT